MPGKFFYKIVIEVFLNKKNYMWFWVNESGVVYGDAGGITSRVLINIA